MICPKCKTDMERIEFEGIEVDRCKNCKGIWFDKGEAERLKDKWMSEFIDTGDPEVGKKHDAISEIDCPRCGKRMEAKSDPHQPHIWFESCEEHGTYFDAGEFTDFKYETFMDKVRTFMKGKRKS